MPDYLKFSEVIHTSLGLHSQSYSLASSARKTCRCNDSVREHANLLQNLTSQECMTAGQKYRNQVQSVAQERQIPVRLKAYLLATHQSHACVCLWPTLISAVARGMPMHLRGPAPQGAYPAGSFLQQMHSELKAQPILTKSHTQSSRFSNGDKRAENEQQAAVEDGNAPAAAHLPHRGGYCLHDSQSSAGFTGSIVD